MKQTEHYGLNQWDPADRILRTDFNADNAKIDAALAELSGRNNTRYFGSFQSVSGPNNGIGFFFLANQVAPYSRVHALLEGPAPTQDAQLHLWIEEGKPLYTTNAKAGKPFFRIITFYPFFDPERPIIFQPIGFDQGGPTILEKNYAEYVTIRVDAPSANIFPSRCMAKFYGES